MSANELYPFFEQLLALYGPQGWWPLLGYGDSNPAATGVLGGYHPGEYAFPRDEREQFEICVGAILTQNTAWANVEKALSRLRAAGALQPGGPGGVTDGALAELIRPSGYFNVKARKLKVFDAFYQRLGGRVVDRQELLGLWGVGPETADSMLLYAFGVPEFVVDAYTRRVLAARGLVPLAIGYEDLKAYCVARLPRDWQVYQEFHALLVEHAKRVTNGTA